VVGHELPTGGVSHLAHVDKARPTPHRVLLQAAHRVVRDHAPDLGHSEKRGQRGRGEGAINSLEQQGRDRRRARNVTQQQPGTPALHCEDKVAPELQKASYTAAPHAGAKQHS